MAIVCCFPDSSHNMVMSFYAPNLDHWCSRPADVNVSVEEWKTIALPPDDQSCSRYIFTNFSHIREERFKNISINRRTTPCTSWEYDDSVYKSTVLSQFNLVCEREWLTSMSKSVFIGGYFLSATLFGYMADKFGRRPIIVLCNVVALFSAIICTFSTSFLMFAICRFFVAAGVTGVDNIAFVLLMEVISPKFRSAYGIGVNIGWITGYLCIPLIAWLLRDWILIQIVITLPCTFLLFSWWLLTESPRWLLANGKIDEAVVILSKIAKRNGSNITDVKLKEQVSKTHKSHEDEKVNINILQLLKSGLWQKTIIVWYLWSVNAFMYYGISYNTNELAGDPFVNFAVYGAVEIPAYIVTPFLIQLKGRKYPLAFSLTVAGISCLMLYPLPKDPWWIRPSDWGLNDFPNHTEDRWIGVAQVNGRIGAALAPFVRELGRASHPIVPQIFFGILAASGGVLALLLPETRNRRVPDTVKEASKISRKSTPKKKTDIYIELTGFKERN
ncbi:organic cation transporter protein [Caerostris extrusa]|uniref:Organic cation transporter protein n=1 Tax=Caerostris extrusa TaxID=172846 RepID=A0AAV4X5G4_CAEEX|nr:organic cation transporter protein [Caerostris extrusa]